MSVVDEIKARLNIVDYISRTVPLKKAGKYYKAPCPFHNERTPSFVVNEDQQYWRCYGACAEGGDLFSFAMKQNGWTFAEALEELAKQAGVELRPQSPENRAQHEALDRLRGLLKNAADLYHQKLFDPQDAGAVAALEYARHKRGLSDETLRRFQIGYAPPGFHHAQEALTALGYSEDDLLGAGVLSKNDQGRTYDRFRNRLLIPIRDERGRVVGFGARALDPNDNPKYLNSPQSPVFDKSRLLFGLDFGARSIRESETAVIVEGYLDAIQAHQAGYANVVAQMGTALTESQLKLIAPRWAKKIILALDADAAGQNATRRSLEVARETLQADHGGKLGVEFRILALPGAKDPDDLIREAPERWRDLVESAIPAAEFVIQMETAGLPPNASVQEREAVARRLLPILLASENDLYRRDNLQKLALRLRIGERDLLVWADEQRKIARAPKPRAPMPEPPEPPNFDEDSPEPPFETTDDLLPDFDTPMRWQPSQGRAAASAPRSKPTESARAARPSQPAGREAYALEAYCLRVLFKQPELYYHVNRKFRELAGDDAALAAGPLGLLCAADFGHSTYRALMLTFEGAMDQHDYEPVEYLRMTLDSSLLAELDALLADQWDGLRPRLRYGLSADLNIALQHNERLSGALDMSAELIEKSLRLRSARLQRERQEMAFLQMDDAAVQPPHLLLSIKAKGLIEAELTRRVRR